MLVHMCKPVSFFPSEFRDCILNFACIASQCVNQCIRICTVYECMYCPWTFGAGSSGKSKFQTGPPECAVYSNKVSSKKTAHQSAVFTRLFVGLAHAPFSIRLWAPLMSQGIRLTKPRDTRVSPAAYAPFTEALASCCSFMFMPNMILCGVSGDGVWSIKTSWENDTLW